jgi:hypothetical protein
MLRCVQANDIGEVDVHEKSFNESNIAQVCTAQVCFAQDRAKQPYAAQVCATQVGDGQVRAAQACAAQVCAAQVRVPPVRAVQVSAAQVSAAQVRAVQVRADQDCATQVCFAQVWNDALVFVTPCVPRGHALFEHRDMLVVRHRSTRVWIVSAPVFLGLALHRRPLFGFQPLRDLLAALLERAKALVQGALNRFSRCCGVAS